MAKYKYVHQPDEETVPDVDIHADTLEHLKSRGFIFVGPMKDGRYHAPKWMLELVRIQERRGDAGGAIDWDLAWTRLHHEPELRRVVHTAVLATMNQHGLLREHADEVAITILREAAPRGKTPAKAIVYDHDDHVETLKVAYAEDLARQAAQQKAATEAAVVLQQEQENEGRKIYSELELKKRVNTAVESERRKLLAPNKG
jgi:hypothetical protein